MAQHQIAVNEIVSKDKGSDIGVRDIAIYLQTLALIDFADDDQIPNLRAVRELVGTLGASAVSITTPTGSYSYSLSPTELSAVNAIGRIPNFVGLVSGQQFYDIYPQYTGSAGAYTAITVQLHNDTDVHLVQFS